MLGLIGVMCAAFFNGLITDGRFMQPYTTARMLFLGAAGYLLLAIWIISGPEIRISGEACSIVLWMVSFWALSAILAKRREQAIRHFLVFAFCVWFGVFLAAGADSLTVIRALVAVAIVSAAVGLIVHVGHVRLYPGIKEITPFALAGLVGNYKAHGIYLMMHVFPAGYLAVADHPLWLAGLGVMLWAIWASMSRTAMLGLFAGGVFFAVTIGLPAEVFVGLVVLLVVSILLKAGAWAKKFGNTDSMRERMNYLKVAWEIIAESPFFGVGFGNFPVHAPFAQRTLNVRTKGKFLDKKNYLFPWPEAAHNEVLQWLCDCGIVGCGPMLLLAGYVGTIAYANMADPLVPCIGASLVGLLAAGATWHVSYILPVSMTAWCWIGLLLKQPNPGAAWSESIPGSVAIPGLIALGYLICRFIAPEGVFRRRFAQYLMSGKQNYLKEALKASPDDGQANLHAARFAWTKGQYETAYKHAVYGIEHYDGQVPLWMLYTNAGNICLQHGSLTLANAYLNSALAFLPWYQPAQIGKAQLAEMKIKFSAGAQLETQEEG